MARVHRINKSAKEHVCGRGGHVIPKGDPYLHAAPGYRGRTLYRCVAHPFRPSELVSGAASEPMAAVEAFTDAAGVGFDSIEDLTTAWDELKSAVEEYLSMREEGLEAWEYGNSMLEELRDTAQEALDEVEDFEAVEYGGEEEPDEEEPESWNEHDTFEEAHEAWEENVQEHVQEQTDEAVGIAEGLTF